jgi:hypothetical protein
MLGKNRIIQQFTIRNKYQHVVHVRTLDHMFMSKFAVA